MAEIVASPPLLALMPTITTDTAEFWEATNEGRLLVRRCRACGEAIWYPRPICPFCHSDDTVWEEASGRARIYSFTVVRRAGGPFGAETPYVLAYVELAEGPRMMTNVVDCDPDALSVDQEVRLVFHATDGAAALPRFRPA
jgi:uncharacterized OB-fold protein